MSGILQILVGLLKGMPNRGGTMSDDFLSVLAMFALAHEVADDGWKLAIERGQSGDAGDMSEGPAAFVDGLALMVAEEKDRLKDSLVSGDIESPGSKAEVSDKLDELSFEVGELRGRLESLQSSLDNLLDQRDTDTGV